MSDYPNIARLAQTDPDKLTSRQLQIHGIRQDCERPARGPAQLDKDARMAAAVPALLAHIDELYGDIAKLQERNGNQADMLAQHRYRRDEQDTEIERLRKERDAAQVEATRIAIATAPAYAQLRDERDSARRERDEAMAKLAKAPAAVADRAVVAMQEVKSSETGELYRGWNAAIAASSVVVGREGGTR